MKIAAKVEFMMGSLKDYLNIVWVSICEGNVLHVLRTRINDRANFGAKFQMHWLKPKKVKSENWKRLESDHPESVARANNANSVIDQSTL